MKLHSNRVGVDFKQFENLVLNLRGDEWRRLGQKKRHEIVESCFLYWRWRGFPYYKLTDREIKNEYKRLQCASKERILIDDEIQMSMVGVKLANYFHPQMWGVRVNRAHAPLERFDSDEKLRLVISRALSVGSDRYSVNECNLRSMLRIFSNTTRVSNFRPTAAKAIFEKYSKDGDSVLDFSAGYGGRLLGCMPLKRHYLGIDPCQAQVRGLRRMITKLETLVSPEVRATINLGCAEDLLPALEPNSVSLVFSSPPYFNNEQYSSEQSQSYVRYPTYDLWLTYFLDKVLSESQRVLKPAGYLILNVADINGFRITEDVLRLASKYFKVKQTLRLRLAHKPYLRNRTGKVHKHEPVFVFRKSRRC